MLALAIGEPVEPLRGELPFVELRPAIAFRRRCGRIVFRTHTETRQQLAPRWCGLNAEGDVRSGTWEEEVRPHRVTRKLPLVGQYVAGTVGEGEHHGATAVVAQLVVLVAQRLAQDEVIIGPRQAFAKTERSAQDVDGLPVRVAHTAVAGVDETAFAIGLHRVVSGEAERVGLAASQPRLHETEAVALEEAAVGLRAHVQRLSITGGKWCPRSFLEGVAHREVGERNTQRKHGASCSPTTAQLQPIARFLFHGVLQVHRSRAGVLDRVHPHGFRVEVAQGAQLALRTHHIAPVEQLARLGADLAPDHVFVGLGVAFDDDVADPVLLPFTQPQVQVYAVAFHQQLHRVGVEGEVTIIHVQRTDVATARVHVQAAVQLLLVVHITLLDVEDVLELLRGVLGVARDVHVAVVELATFVHGDVDAQAVRRNVVHRVLHDGRVAEALLVVNIHHVGLVGLVFAEDEFAAAEDVPPPFAARLLHRFAQAFVRQLVVAFEGDILDLHLRPFVHEQFQRHEILSGTLRGVGHFHDADIGFQIALVHEVLADVRTRAGLERVVHLQPRCKVPLVADLVAFVARYRTGEGGVAQARVLHHHDVEEDRAAAHFSSFEADVAEELLVPQVLQGFGDALARDGDLVAHLQAGEELHGVGVGGPGAAHGDATDLVFHRHGTIEGGARGLRPGSAGDQCSEKEVQVAWAHAGATCSLMRPKRRSRFWKSSTASKRCCLRKSGHRTSVNHSSA